MDVLTIPSVLKAAIELAKQAKDVELQSALLDLRESVNELREENLTLKEEKSALTQRLAVKQQLTKKGDLYFLEGDSDPLCVHCYDSEGKSIHLTGGYQLPNGRAFKNCNRCKNHYEVPR